MWVIYYIITNSKIWQAWGRFSPCPWAPWGDSEQSPPPTQSLPSTRASYLLAKGCPKSRASEERQCCPGLTHPALNRGAGTCLSADTARMMASMLSSTKASLPCGRAINLAGHAEVLANRVNKGFKIKCQWEVGGDGVWLVSARTGCFWQDILRYLVQSSFKCPWWWGMLGSEFSQSSLLPVAATHSLKGASWAWEKAELPSSLVQRGHVGKHGNWALAGQEQKAQCRFFHSSVKSRACQPLLID